MKILGQTIRERREELDLSLREFAKLLQCSPPFVSDVEHSRRFPSDQMLAEMAKVLKLDFNDLKQLDPRAPLDDIRRMAERNPTYAVAFRTIVEEQTPPEELIRFALDRSKPKA